MVWIVLLFSFFSLEVTQQPTIVVPSQKQPARKAKANAAIRVLQSPPTASVTNAFAFLSQCVWANSTISNVNDTNQAIHSTKSRG